MDRLEKLCHDHGLRFTKHQRTLLDVLEASDDHLSVREIHRRAAQNHRIGIATIYRTLNRLVQVGAVTRRNSGDGTAHYDRVGRHRNHLIDMKSGNVFGFDEAGMASVLEDAAQQLGYRLVDYRLILFAESSADADELGPLLTGNVPPSG